MNVQMAAIEDFDILEIVKGMDMDKMHELLYLMFENDQNSCWLDACIVLIANNRSFQDSVEGYPDSQIRKFTEKYKEAIAVLNDSNQPIPERLEKTREMLQDIQNSTLCYLKQFLKFKPGEPESAFYALLNLIYHDNSKVKENICTSWIWQKNCGNCGLNSKSSLFTKPFITLPKVNDFRPESPVCVYTCSCKAEQEMKLVYKELPNCLIFHFENGAGTGNNIPLIFTVNERKYQLTSVVMFNKRSDQNLSHFVTWIRHPFVNMWLDCNDLNTNIVQFSENKPELELKDVYMCVYEAFDGLGKISHEVVADDEQTQDINAEVIDLLDEGDDLEVISNVAESKTPPDTINCESSTSLDALEIKTKTTEADSKNVTTNAYTNNKCAVIVSPNGIKYENKISSINYVSENMSLDAPEVKTKTGKTDSESIISRVLNEKNKSPCEILVNTRDISEKCVEDREIEEMPKNKVTVEEEMPKNKVTVEGNNSSSSKRQALDEKHKSRKKQKVEEKDSQQNADEKTVAIQKPVVRIESLLDTVVPNVFAAFMEQILRIQERKN